jgi:transcriptional regulator with XRE-family HTH domain
MATSQGMIMLAPGVWGVGALIVAHREARGLTQEDLANRAGLSVRAVSDIERGRTRSPHSRTIRLLATALELSQAELRRFLDLRRDDLGPRMSSYVPDEAAYPLSDLSPLPRQLPMAVRPFVGRERELAQLSELLDEDSGSVSIAVINGAAGVGKTALAMHWAHQIAKRFPDGQLYVDLRGSGSGSAPLLPSEVLKDFLHALRSPARHPASHDAQVARYRSLLAGKRVLIVLDNARDPGQVVPLLPGSPGCLVLVTCRGKLPELVARHGAQPVVLDPLTARDALELLNRLLGAARVSDEKHAVAALIDRCGRIPVRLRDAAAIAAVSPTLSLSDVTPKPCRDRG